MQGKQGAAGNPQHITHTVCPAFVCLCASLAQVGIKVERNGQGGGLCVCIQAKTSCRSPSYCPYTIQSAQLHKSLPCSKFIFHFFFFFQKERGCAIQPERSAHNLKRHKHIEKPTTTQHAVLTQPYKHLQTIGGGVVVGVTGERRGEDYKQNKNPRSLLQPLCHHKPPRKALKNKSRTPPTERSNYSSLKYFLLPPPLAAPIFGPFETDSNVLFIYLFILCLTMLKGGSTKNPHNKFGKNK